MSDKTGIEWADATWNPVTGCTPASLGCYHCYAARMAKRLAGRYGYPSEEPFRVTEHMERIADPVRWRRPRRVFVCSMGDLFHEDVTVRMISEVYVTMSYAPQHTFIVLTKRPERLVEMLYQQVPLPNVWHLTTVEHQVLAKRRIGALLELRDHAPWPVLGVSVEPMLGPVDLRPWLPELQWVICGAETGPGARRMDLAWARDLHDQCEAAGVPFFFKRASDGSRLVWDHMHEEWPAELER